MTDTQADKAARRLTAADILAGGEEPYRELEIPELKKGGAPGILYLKPLSAGDMLDLAAAEDLAPVERRNQMLQLIAKTVVDPDTGQRVFTVDQVDELRTISAKLFTRLMTAINEGAGVGVAAKEEAGKD